VTLALAAGAVEPRRPGQDSFLTRAVFAEGRLWMRSDAGIVFSVAQGELQRRVESLPGAVLEPVREERPAGRAHVCERRLDAPQALGQ